MKEKNENRKRNALIRSLRGRYSYNIIARMVGCSKSTVAGVCWRSDWDPSERIGSANSPNSQNKCGIGHHGPGEYPAITLYDIR